MDDSLRTRLAARLRALRTERGWSLERLARDSGVSRASLSRLELGEVSPTTEMLAKLCTAYGLSLTRLLSSVEPRFPPLVRRAEQSVWHDPSAGFLRRSVSPPAGTLSAEGLECELSPRARLRYDAPATPDQEHHLYLLDGGLRVELGETRFDLHPGDCLRYRLGGPSHFVAAPEGARYLLFLI